MALESSAQVTNGSYGPIPRAGANGPSGFAMWDMLEVTTADFSRWNTVWPTGGAVAEKFISRWEKEKDKSTAKKRNSQVSKSVPRCHRITATVAATNDSHIILNRNRQLKKESFTF